MRFYNTKYYASEQQKRCSTCEGNLYSLKGGHNVIKHIVMWKLKEGAECGDRIQNMRKMKQDLEALRAKIPQVRHIEVGINAIPSEASYDVVLYSEFENEKDLDLYQKHPEHVKVAEFVATIRERRAVVDYHAG
jgi:hypothetical protein